MQFSNPQKLTPTAILPTQFCIADITFTVKKCFPAIYQFLKWTIWLAGVAVITTATRVADIADAATGFVAFWALFHVVVLSELLASFRLWQNTINVMIKIVTHPLQRDNAFIMPERSFKSIFYCAT